MLQNIFSSAPPRRTTRFVKVPMHVRGRYDAAVTTEENRRHWANADHLWANAANSAAVRRTLRSRSRYEVANNNYARGIVLTLANDVVGTGPRLQMLTDDGAGNRNVEQAFARWSEATRLPEKLRTMRMARAESGEVFGLLSVNPLIDSPAKLDLRLIEADQVRSFSLAAGESSDGIVYDRFGNAIEYHILRNHPGEGRGDITYNDDTTLFFSPQSFTIGAGWSYEILEYDTGGVWKWNGSNWTKPTGTDPRGATWYDNQTENLPHQVKRFARLTKGDYITIDLLNELHAAINAFRYTKKGIVWKSRANPDAPENNQRDSALSLANAITLTIPIESWGEAQGWAELGWSDNARGKDAGDAYEVDSAPPFALAAGSWQPFEWEGEVLDNFGQRCTAAMRMVW